MAGYGLPSSLFPPEFVDEIALKQANTRLRNRSPDKRPRSRRNGGQMEINNDSPTSPPDTPINDADNEQLRDSVFKCIAHLIGMTPSKASQLSSKSASAKKRRPSLPSIGPSGVERFYYSTNRGMGTGSHISSIPSSRPSRTRKHSYLDADDLSSVSMSSRTSSVGHGDDSSDEENDFPDVQIRYFRHGEILVKEGERNGGLYFVIDGTLEVSATSKRPFGVDGKTEVRRGTLFKILPGGLAGYLAALTGIL